MSSVASTTAEYSMSMRTKLPSSAAVSTTRRTFSKAISLRVEAEMRELQRDVGAQLLVVQRCEDRLVLGRDRARLLLVRHVLAEHGRVRMEPLVVEPAETATHSSRVSPATNRAAPSRMPCLPTNDARGALAPPRG
jgi:hypothetical protein